MATRKVSILGIPTDLGANVIGARYAPNKIRNYLLPVLKKLKVNYIDFGNVLVPKRGLLKNPDVKYLNSITRTCHNLGEKRKCFSKEYFPIILGGDHTITSCYLNEIVQKRKIGIIYFDAHGDYNTPKTTPSGNIHGMVLTAVLKGSKLITHIGYIRPKNIVMISVRALDKEESRALSKSSIKVFSSKDIQNGGIEKIMKKAIKIASKGVEGFHLSVDLDSVDPRFAPGVSTPVKNGLTRREILTAMKLMSKSSVLSADFVEVNPKRDKNDKTSKLVARMIKVLLK